MSISEPPNSILCNTTPTRIFAIVGQMDLLVEIFGGEIFLPRTVFDPDEDPDGVTDLRSEIARSERFWAKRSSSPNAVDNWFRLRALRERRDIVTVDMSLEEENRYAKLLSVETQRRYGLAIPLGPGEAAVMAIAESRKWSVAMDDFAARQVLAAESPTIGSITTRDLVRRAVSMELLDSDEAGAIYNDMLDAGYRGPGLWD